MIASCGWLLIEVMLKIKKAFPVFGEGLKRIKILS